MNKSNSLILVLIAFLTIFGGFEKTLYAEDAPTEFRFRYVGASIFATPTGNCLSSVSYINDDSRSSALITQSLGDLLEVSVLRHLDKDYKGKNIINGKFALISEGRFMPAVSLGVADVNTQLGDRIYFAAASKNFEDFGLLLNAGVYRDPIDKKKKSFFGVEKVIFPLLTIAAERCDDIDTYGIKISPYPGLSLNVAQRDGKDELFNLVYMRKY